MARQSENIFNRDYMLAKVASMQDELSQLTINNISLLIQSEYINQGVHNKGNPIVLFPGYFVRKTNRTKLLKNYLPIELFTLPTALFVKAPQRIMALLRVMLLSLLVYGVAERRMRACLAAQKETLPSPIHQDTEAPTLRWIFQLLLGIHTLKVSTGNQSHQVIEGVTPLREKILQLFDPTVAEVYKLSYKSHPLNVSIIES